MSASTNIELLKIFEALPNDYDVVMYIHSEEYGIKLEDVYPIEKIITKNKCKNVYFSVYKSKFDIYDTTNTYSVEQLKKILSDYDYDSKIALSICALNNKFQKIEIDKISQNNSKKRIELIGKLSA